MIHWVAVVGLALTLFACSAPQTRQLVNTWPSGLPDGVELADTPFFPQERYQCGPAALATVLNRLGVVVTPDALRQEIYLPDREGSLRTEIIAATRARGLLAYPTPIHLDAILRELDAGNPVLVMQNLGLDWAPQWHFAVVIGYSRDHQEFILRSGTLARHTLTFRTFEQTWARADHWGLVINRPEAKPVPASALDYLAAGHALRDRGHHKAAHRSFETASVTWPDNALVWLAAGNSAFLTGSLELAEQRFLRAVELSADNAAAWNNLAYVQGELGCVAVAKSHAHCARALAPDNSEVASTLLELQGKRFLENW